MNATPTYHYLEGQLGQKSDYGHFFGHDPELQGVSTEYNGYDIHLILTIDCTDPILAEFKLPTNGLLRLAHPLYTSEGDRFVQEQPSDHEVFFSKLRRDKDQVAPLKADHDWPYPECPSFFPKTPIRFIRKQAPMFGTPQALYPDLAVDRIIIGNPSPTVQDLRSVNSDGMSIYDQICPKCGTKIRPTVTVPCLFELNPCANLKGGEPTGLSWDVLTVFWVCNNCKTTISHNDCD